MYEATVTRMRKMTLSMLFNPSMTVKELREALNELPDDMTVVIPAGAGQERNGDFGVALSMKTEELHDIDNGWFVKEDGLATKQVLIIS